MESFLQTCKILGNGDLLRGLFTLTIGRVGMPYDTKKQNQDRVSTVIFISVTQKSLTVESISTGESGI